MRLRQELTKEESDKRALGREFMDKCASIRNEADVKIQELIDAAVVKQRQIDDATTTWQRHLNAALLEIRRLTDQLTAERGASLKTLIQQLSYSTSDRAFLLAIVTELNKKLDEW